MDGLHQVEAGATGRYSEYCLEDGLYQVEVGIASIA